MKIEDLLDCQEVEQLEKLSLADLDAIFMPYFNVTRPDLARSAQAKKAPISKLDKLDKMISIAEKAKNMGVDIGDILKGLKW